MKALIIFVIACTACSASRSTTSDTSGTSTVIVKVNYNSHGLRGFGGYLQLRNLETNVVFNSTVKIGYRPFIFVENLPQGQYIATELAIITGGLVIPVIDQGLFDTLDLNTASNYYIGNYLVKKIKPRFEYHIRIARIADDSEKKIQSTSKKYKIEYDPSSSVFGQHLLKNDTTEIRVR